MAEYDILAKNYTDINYGRPLFSYAVYPSFFEIIGNLNGKSVLDLACGNGEVTRQLVRLGADKVVGIDISEEMLRIAREQEKSKPLGITYQLGKVGGIGKIDEFDVVTGAFLLHYAKTRKELFEMCADVAVNLKSSGCFVAINNNPDHPLNPCEKYQNTIEAEKPLREGDVLRVSYGVDGKNVFFKNYFWQRKTYDEFLKRSGLIAEWLPIQPTDGGVAKFGKTFWTDFLEAPFFALIRAHK